MSFFKKTESYLGIDIGAGGLKLVELRKTKNRPQLWTYGILDQPLDIHIADDRPEALPSSGDKGKKAPARPLDPRIAEYAGFLKHLIKETKATTTRVTASLPVSQVFHAVVTLPVVPEKELEYHVRAKVTKMLPRPIEEMQVVHQLLGPKKDLGRKDIKVLVTAAHKSVIRFYTDIFQAAGLTLEELETEAFALVRSLVGRDTATVMIVDIGAERTNFFIIDNGIPVTHRSITIGGAFIDELLGSALGVDRGMVGQMKYDLSRSAGAALPAELFTRMTDPIIKEIQYGFDLYLHQTGNVDKRPEKIVLTGGAALFPPLFSAIRDALNIKVFVGDPWARVVYQQRLKSTLDVIGPRMGVSIGLALRGVLPDTLAGSHPQSASHSGAGLV